MTKICAMFLTLAFAMNAFGEGQLTFSMQNKFGFQKIQLNEINGIRDGNMISGMSQITTRSYVKNNQLAIQVGTKTDVLDIKDLGGSLLYRGFFDGTTLVSIQVYPRRMGGFMMQGTVGEVPFKAETDGLTKTFVMTWNKTNELQLWTDLNPRKMSGACRGAIGVLDDRGMFEEQGKFNCSSSGSMKDSLFRNPNDVIANLVHLLIASD